MNCIQVYWADFIV